MVLVLGRQLAEVAAPAPYPDDQVLVKLRVDAGIQQLGGIETVELELLAGVGAGAWRDVPAACKQTVRITGRNLPDPAQVDSYRKAYPIYRELYPALKPYFGASGD